MSYSVRGDDEDEEAERADDDDDDDDSDEVVVEEDAGRDRRAAEEDDGENAQAVIVIPPEAGMASRAATLNLIIDLINYSDDIIIIPFRCLVFVSIKCSLFMLLCVFEGTKNFRPTEWIHRGELLPYDTCSFAFWIFHYFTIPLIRGADGRADKNKSGGELMSGG